MLFFQKSVDNFEIAQKKHAYFKLGDLVKVNLSHGVYGVQIASSIYFSPCTLHMQPDLTALSLSVLIMIHSINGLASGL